MLQENRQYPIKGYNIDSSSGDREYPQFLLQSGQQFRYFTLDWPTDSAMLNTAGQKINLAGNSFTKTIKQHVLFPDVFQMFVVISLVKTHVEFS